jgi:putative transposase
VTSDVTTHPLDCFHDGIIRWINVTGGLLDAAVPSNSGERPHSSLGPGIPDGSIAVQTSGPQRQGIPRDCRIVAKPILGGLHHEYRLEKRAA